MAKFKLTRPSNGTVLGFIAIVIAIVGTANAAPTKHLVQRGDIAPGAVTARTLAPGAVHSKAIAANAVNSKKLAKDAVNRRVLAKGSVTARAISANAVTSAGLAPGSVYGAALGSQTIHTAPITDIDMAPENGKWTPANTQAAFCGPGERLLGAGFAMTEPGNGEVAWTRAQPFVSPNSNGANGQFSSNSGGTAKGEIIVLCLQ